MPRKKNWKKAETKKTEGQGQIVKVKQKTDITQVPPTWGAGKSSNIGAGRPSKWGHRLNRQMNRQINRQIYVSQNY